MDFLALLFVGKPINIFIVATFFLLTYFIIKNLLKGIRLHVTPLLVIAILWGVYAVWEWLVVNITPEANIRVDIILIWPLLAISTFWQLLRIFR